ncbi:MAG: hypothetical protein MZV63_66360 [Marinilabiliales bacterium]|nr:hypothetical protein [Marinilabiliales bacterium]
MQNLKISRTARAAITAALLASLSVCLLLTTSPSPSPRSPGASRPWSSTPATAASRRGPRAASATSRRTSPWPSASS